MLDVVLIHVRVRVRKFSILRCREISISSSRSITRFLIEIHLQLEDGGKAAGRIFV